MSNDADPSTTSTVVGTSYRRPNPSAASTDRSIDMDKHIHSNNRRGSFSSITAGAPPSTSIGPSTAIFGRSPVVANAISPIDASLMSKGDTLQSPFWHQGNQSPAITAANPTPVVRTPIAGAGSTSTRKDRGAGMNVFSKESSHNEGRKSVSPVLPVAKTASKVLGEKLVAPTDRSNVSQQDISQGVGGTETIVPIVERTGNCAPKEAIAPQPQRPVASQATSLQSTARESSNPCSNNNDQDASSSSMFDDSYDDIISQNAKAEGEVMPQKRKNSEPHREGELAPQGIDGGAVKTKEKKEGKHREKKNAAPVLPEGHVEVPLVKPRYERKTRTTNQISVTDYASDGTLGSISDMLRHTSVEKMSVRHGDNYYEGTVQFHTYSVFRHGARKIVARSVGYASDGDLVIHRFDVAERSESNNESFPNIKLKTTEIHDAVCLDYKARRPMTDGEEEYLRRTKQINKKKHRKYPGVKAPRNKKIRQRLMNDAVTATDDFKQAFARAERRFAAERAARGDVSDSESSNGSDEYKLRARGAFQNVPPRYHKLMHQDEDKQTAFLDKIGVSHDPSQNANSSKATPVSGPIDPNSAEGRFNLLNTRLRDEAKRALVSEYLTGLINELDQDFSDYIRFSVPMVGEMNTPPFGPGTPPMLPPPMRDFSTCGDDFPMKLPTPSVGEFAFPRGRSPQSLFPSQPLATTVKRSEANESLTPTPTTLKPPGITEIERVANALPDNAPPQLSYAFRDGYGRLICHAVAAYYKLISSSEEDKTSGSRKTFVQFPESKRARALAMILPPIPFLQFLRMKTRNYSASNGFETPPMGPADTLSPPLMNHEDTAPPFPVGGGLEMTKTAIRKLRKEQKEQERTASREVIDDSPVVRSVSGGNSKKDSDQKRRKAKKPDDSPASTRERSTTPENYDD